MLMREGVFVLQERVVVSEGVFVCAFNAYLKK